MDYTGPLMTLGNMRSLGVRSLQVYCNACNHDGVLDVESRRSDDLPVKWFEPRMVCTKCGSKSVDVRPNWAEYKPTKGLSDPR